MNTENQEPDQPRHRDPDTELLQKTADRLNEHFDSVIIIATRYEGDRGGETSLSAAGAGNFYARLGSLREWLTVQDQRVRNFLRSEEKDQE